MENQKSAGELAYALAKIHASFSYLILGLRKTQCSEEQDALINEAEAQLYESQSKFFTPEALALLNQEREWAGIKAMKRGKSKE